MNTECTSFEGEGSKIALTPEQQLQVAMLDAKLDAIINGVVKVVLGALMIAGLVGIILLVIGLRDGRPLYGYWGYYRRYWY